MPFTPKAWLDNPGGGTPIMAADLNRIEAGIKESGATTIQVTADGTTDVSGTIQTVLDTLVNSVSRSYEVIVEPAYPHVTTAVIYLNNKVRITTSNTRVRFKAPVKLGTGCDPDGNGCLSILGSQTGTQTVTSGATRGNTVITVGSATGLAIGQMVRIFDNSTVGGGASGDRTEIAEIIDLSGTTVTLDHPLHHTYSGSITLAYLAAIFNSGFEDVQATFSGQQAAAFVFPAKMQYGRNCYFRNCHFKGNPSNSWSRECLNVRYSYRCFVENCSVSYSWDNAVGSTYSYGFSCDSSTSIVYDHCFANSLRHGFSADKGSAGVLYVECISDVALASGFDLHGAQVRDVTYVGCVATSAPDGKQADDGQHFGFLAGNTTFIAGSFNVSYFGCVARGFAPYTRTNALGPGEAAGFGVVDGAANVVFQSCRAYDCQQGILVLSEGGAPITNIGIYNCEFNNLTSSDAVNRPPLPIYVHAGTAPNDVNGLIIDGCRINGATVSVGLQVYGTASNTIGDITIVNNTWIRSQGAVGAFALDCRYNDRLVIKNNSFCSTRRGITLTNCIGAVVVDNLFSNLTEPAHAIRDSGGNTNMIFAKNLISPAASAYGTTPTSTGAYIDITGPTNTPTASRPSLTAGTVGALIYNPTTNKIEVWNGTAWVATAALT